MRDFIFDDPFISFRYAKNLALGYGITWNPNEQPVEGYTNFLLVLLLAPFIKIGVSPLLATRVFSFVAAASISLLLYKTSTRDYKASKVGAALVSLTFLLSTQTSYLCMVGLETVIYAGVLFWAFVTGARFFKENRLKDIYRFSLLSFLALLLRPEAGLLVMCFGIVMVIYYMSESHGFRPMIKTGLILSVSFFTPLAIYLVWKYVHFDSLLPLPFYVKATSADLIVPSGWRSIQTFWTLNFTLILAALFSFIVAKENRWQRAFAAFATIVFVLFFLRVDTLMDVAGRFLYPASVFLAYLSIPTILLVSKYLFAERRSNLVKVPLVLIFLVVALNQNSAGQTVDYFMDFLVRGKNRFLWSDDLMQKERVAGLALSKYEHIESTRIAFGDAGVIPYFSGALHLDVAGLNDKFIARERNLGKLTDYIFNQKPDLILHPANKDYSWIKYGHGSLGNIAEWNNDPRWDQYSYVGTIKTAENIYDIHFFLRIDYHDYNQFESFLEKTVIDGEFENFPLPIGTYVPNDTIPIVWIGRNGFNN